MNPVHTSWRYCRTRPVTAILVGVVATGGLTCVCAAFLLVNALLFRPLPGIPRSHELVVASFVDSANRTVSAPLAFFEGLTTRDSSMSAWCPVYDGSLLRIVHDDVSASRAVTRWTPACAEVFQIQPALGRLWDDNDAIVPAVLGHTYWEQEFGGSKDVLGRSLLVDDVSVTVIGVAPAGFTGLDVEIEPAVLVPIDFKGAAATQNPIGENMRTLVGRRAPGASVSHLESALSARLAQLVTDSQALLTERQVVSLSSARVAVDVSGLGESHLRDLYAQPLRFLMLAAGLLLFTAVFNVAGLATAQAVGRDPEFSIRRALGARRFQNVSQLLSEGVLPITFGAFAAVPAALVLAREIASGLWTSGTPLTLSLIASTDVWIFQAIVALAMVAAFGLAPSLSLARREAGLHRSDRGTRASRRTATVVTVGQLALSVTLAVLATMLTRSVSELEHVDRGYRTQGLSFARIIATQPNVTPGDPAHYQDTLEQLEQQPGVTRAAYASAFPNAFSGTVSPADRPDVTLEASKDTVSNNFFDTLGIPLVAGRYFSAVDSPNSRPVVILTKTLAASLFPGSPAIGRLITVGDVKEPRFEVVGIVGDHRLSGARQPFTPVVYRPRGQEFRANPMIFAQADASSIFGANGIRQTLQAVGRDYTASVTTIEQYLSRQLAPERTLRLLAVTFGGFVVLLAGIGLFAVQTTMVMQQRRQTCIRLALGESPSHASVRQARHAFGWILLGVALGLPAAGLLAEVARGLLFGLSPFDPTTLAQVTLWFLGIGAAVALLPTRSVYRVNVVDVLKTE